MWRCSGVEGRQWRDDGRRRVRVDGGEDDGVDREVRILGGVESSRDRKKQEEALPLIVERTFSPGPSHRPGLKGL